MQNAVDELTEQLAATDIEASNDVSDKAVVRNIVASFSVPPFEDLEYLAMQFNGSYRPNMRCISFRCNGCNASLFVFVNGTILIAGTTSMAHLEDAQFCTYHSYMRALDRQSYNDLMPPLRVQNVVAGGRMSDRYRFNLNLFASELHLECRHNMVHTGEWSIEDGRTCRVTVHAGGAYHISGFTNVAELDDLNTHVRNRLYKYCELR